MARLSWPKTGAAHPAATLPYSVQFGACSPMPRKRLPQARAPRYRGKGHDVLRSNWAVELSEAPKQDGKYRTQLEIKDGIVGRLQSLLAGIERVAHGELVPNADQWGPQDDARLLLYANDKDYRRAFNRADAWGEPLPKPDLAAAQTLVQELIDDLLEMDDPDWRKQLRMLLKL